MGLDSPTAQGAQAGQELLKGEWLGQVVVRSGVQAAYAILYRIQGRKQEDRRRVIS